MGNPECQPNIFLIQDMVSFHAGHRPSAIIVHDAEGVVRYGEMDAYTNRLARFLLAQGAGRGERVAFFMGKSRRSVQALLGILKADAVYVPLDSQAPEERVRMILVDCGCRFLITDAAAAPKAINVAAGLGREMTVIMLGEDVARTDASPNVRVVAVGVLNDFDASPRSYENVDTDLAYIIYTSGSTGEPKGVMIRHASVLDYARWTVCHFGVTPDDRFSSHAGMHFDLSVFDVFTAFLAGASLHPVPRAASLFPIKFLDFVEERGITIWCSVPSFLTYVAKSGVLVADRMPSLRAVTFCGEVMPTTTIIAWMEKFPHLRYVNQYGPTETTCASMYYDIEGLPGDPAQPLSIGRPIPNSEVFALTEDGRRAEKGEVGELYIRGIGISLGYWRQPEKTGKAFVQNPLLTGVPDVVYATGDLVRPREGGAYDFVGRKDTQIKYMGYRVELGDIEAALATMPGVIETAVIAVKDSISGGLMIVAFVASGDLRETGAIEHFLKGKLPSYMIPKCINIMDAFPRNRNGKTDRLELKRLVETHGGKG